MKRDMTITGRFARTGTNNMVTTIVAGNYAGEELRIDLMNQEAEGFDVYDVITVTVEVNK